MGARWGRHARASGRLAVPPAPPSIAGQFGNGARATRGLGHVVLAAAAAERSGRHRWLVLGAASLVADELIARELGRDDRPASLWPALVSTVDAAVWSTAPVRDLVGRRTIAVVSLSATTARTAFDVWSGDEVQPSVASPDVRLDRRASARLGVTALAPVAAMAVGARVRGVRSGLGPLGWAVVAVGVGAGVARARRQLQESARERWRRRSERNTEWEWLAARMNAMVEARGHDFKKVLLGLKSLGSQRAGVALAEQQSHPSLTYEAVDGGMLLHEAARRMDVEPDEEGSRWLSAPQVRQLREFIDDAFEDAPEGVPVVLTVSGTRQGIEVAMLGRRAVLVNPLPPLVGNFDPAGVGMAYAAAQKALAVLPSLGAVPPGFAIPAALADAVVALTYWHRPPEARHAAVLLGVAAGSTAVFQAAVALGGGATRLPDGSHLCPATGATQGALLALAHYWSGLPRWRWGLGALLVGGWAAATVLPERRPPVSLVTEAAYAIMPALGIVGLRSRADAEEDQLERRLGVAHRAEVLEVRRQAAEVELDRYRAQVELARQELAALEGQADAELWDRLRQECEEQERWLSSETVVDELAW